MIFYDVDALNARFWATTLTYKDATGASVNLADGQKLVENGPEIDLDEKKPWVRWTINPGASARDTLGTSPIFKSLGTATLQIFVPKGLGASISTDILDSFLDSFRDWRSADKKLRIYKVDQTKGNDKAFLQVNATIFYESLRQ